MKQTITIAGAGSGYTPGIILTMLNQEDFEVEEIRLYDNDTEKNHDMEIIMKYIIEKESYNVSLKRTEDPKEAFRSEEHTSELQSRGHLVCRLLLEKKKN